MFNGKLQVDVAFSGVIPALHALNVFSKYSRSTPSTLQEFSGSMGRVFEFADWDLWAAEMHSDG